MDVKLRQLAKCTQAITRCVQTVEDGVAQEACVAKAKGKCTAVLERELVLARTKLGETIAERCGGVEFVPSIVDARLGLGYERVAATCATQFDVPKFDELKDVSACVEAAHACWAERLFDLVEPRAQELLTRAGIAAELRSTLGCVGERPGAGGGVEDKAKLGRPLTRCSAALKRAAARFAARKQAALGRCVTAAFVCEQSKQADASCEARAVETCTRALTRAAGERPRLSAVSRRACDGVPYAALLDARGIGLGALETECADYGVDGIGGDFTQYAACLMQHHECRAEELVAIEMPRAAELFETLGAAGLNPALQFPNPICPVASPAP